VDALGAPVVNSFTGRSRLWVADGVLKWAPNGNSTVTNFKLQGEYFRRMEDGQLTYDDTSGSNLFGGPVMGAFGFQGHHGAAGIVGRGGGAVFSGQIACKPVEVACGHPHGESMADLDERPLKRALILPFQCLIPELHARLGNCYIPHPTSVDFRCAAKAFF
jgi:hypothetical protein